MATIRLRVENNPDKKFRVEAQTIPAGGNQPDQGWGNVDTTGGTCIKWDGKFNGPARPSKYTVTFRYVLNDAAAWPFVQKADGTGVAPPDYVGPLVLPVNGQDSVELTTKDEDLRVKYDVVAEPKETIVALDPVIIIRKPAGISANLVLPVTCAVLGAIVGALATALLM
jgi:hypothetical protein